MNGNFSLFRKSDPLIYKLRDLGRLLALVGAFVIYVWIKPLNAKIEEGKVDRETIKIDVAVHHEAIAELKSSDLVTIEKEKNILDALKDVQDDLDWLIKERGGKK